MGSANEEQGLNSPCNHKLQVKVIPQERYRAHVRHKRAHDARNHDGVPRRDLNRHHQQLVEHERRVAHRHHARALDLGQDLREALDHAALVDGHEDPDEEGPVREGAARRELFVELRVEVREVLVDVLVEDEGEDGRCGVDCCVADEEPVLYVLLGIWGE
jgi:hypothetical protein